MRASAARGIRILEPMGFLEGPDTQNLPVVGSVPAGSPVLADESVETSVPCQMDAINHEPLAALVDCQRLPGLSLFEIQPTIASLAKQCNCTTKKP